MLFASRDITLTL